MSGLSAADAAHLLRRTGFGVLPSRRKALTGLGRRAAVDSVLDVSRNPPPPVSPSFVSDPSLVEYDRWFQSVRWWVERMRTVPAPIEEKLTLILHGHFTSSQSKVKSTPAMYRQNLLYRRHALGSYRELVHAMAVEPAMLLYLDNASNRAGTVQENFGRELLELFTLGAGNFTEVDVVTASHAWTGHGLDSSRTRYVFDRNLHDGNRRTFLGTTRSWDGPDTLDEILLRAGADASSRWITAALFSHLAYPVAPTDPVVQRLAGGFRSTDLSLRHLVRSILLSSEFWSDRARHALVRTPVEFFVAAMQALSLPASVANPEKFMERTGQVLFRPPNVSGWGQNHHWVSTAASAGKAAFATSLRAVARDGGGPFAGFERLSSPVAVQRALATFGVVQVSKRTRSRLEAWHAATASSTPWAVATNLIPAVLLTPEFQLA